MEGREPRRERSFFLRKTDCCAPSRSASGGRGRGPRGGWGFGRQAGRRAAPLRGLSFSSHVRLGTRAGPPCLLSGRNKSASHGSRCAPARLAAPDPAVSAAGAVVTGKGLRPFLRSCVSVRCRRVPSRAFFVWRLPRPFPRCSSGAKAHLPAARRGLPVCGLLQRSESPRAFLCECGPRVRTRPQPAIALPLHWASGHASFRSPPPRRAVVLPGRASTSVPVSRKALGPSTPGPASATGCRAEPGRWSMGWKACPPLLCCSF